MFLLRTLRSVYFILMTEMVYLSTGHSTCDHDRVMKSLFYMCKSYSQYPSLKRETSMDKGFGRVLQGGENGPTPPQQSLYTPNQYRLHLGGFRDFPAPFPLFNAFYPWQRVPNTPTGKGDGETANSVNGHFISPPSHNPSSDMPNEPEDFASFNNWYLNPVYADSDWQSAIERWRRKVVGGDSHMMDEIWRFVNTKCCHPEGKGCAFPEDYWELDRKVNFCGLV